MRIGVHGYAWLGDIHNRTVLVDPHGTVAGGQSWPPEGNRVPPQIKSFQELEREHIENILAFTGYEKKRAAQILDISRPTLDKRIREYDLRLPNR